MRQHLTPILAVLAAAALLGACSDDGADDQVATAGGDATESAAESTAASDDAQALAFAECMRENGIDMPDPTAGLEGLLEAATASSSGHTDAELTAAISACESELPAFDEVEGVDVDEEALLAHTECLREQGLDISDDLEDTAQYEEMDPELLDAAFAACEHLLNGTGG
ncbi:hypothetical protein [Glycomyces harbinensis]|uniref:Secreted protein n=1 Tax=Glycomyces harbinensis TaxID=58114 RepID=A0A1G7B245_9ACTN|nr:hypothetical protein [Glycomyces harbinensis]SDE21093.1 hypothetical protein SAMN05216270_11597 [Glycomyces harbinensis]